MIVTETSGIGALQGNQLQGPGSVNWQLVPSSDAGGTTPDGQNYTISASIDYAYGGRSYHFATQAETETVPHQWLLRRLYRHSYLSTV